MSKNEPKIRFKREDGSEFPDWEDKKIGDIMSVTSCKRVHASDWISGGVPFYRAREIVALHDNRHIEPLFISEELYEEYSIVSGKIQVGDLLVTGVGTIGIQYLVRKDDRFYFKDGNIIWLKNGDNVYGKYLYYTFDTQYVKTQLKDMAGIGTVATYTIDSAKQTRIFVPCRPEQQKIAGFLSTLDSIIALQSKKVEKMKELKKGYMQKIFSQEIRFKREGGGEYPEWEVDRLADIAKVNKGKQLNRNAMNGKGKYYVLNGGIAPSGRHTEFNTAANTISLSEGGESCGYVNLNKEEFWAGGHLYTLSEMHCETQFIFQALKYNEKAIMRLRVGSGLPNIQKGAIEDFLIQYPCITEQQKIANFLSTIDSTIVTETKLLSALQLFKKGLLQQMFV